MSTDDFYFMFVDCISCKICNKVVQNNHKAIQCDNCDFWVHTKCNLFNDNDYEKFKQDSSLEFTCLKCNALTFPFVSLDNAEYTCVNKGLSIENVDLSPTPQQQAIINKIMKHISSNSFSLNGNTDYSCEYLSARDFKKKNFSEENHFSIFHMNIHSIERHIDEVRTLFNLLNFHFDFLCFTESKILDGYDPITDISISGYQEPVSIPTAATKGGVLLYVKTGIDFTTRYDLQMKSDKQIESLFIEVFNKKEKNCIIGAVYRHPTMDANEFLRDHLNLLTTKLAKENKPVYLAGDWNFNLLNFNNHEETLLFVDTMMTALLAPTISIPTRITDTGATLSGNIFTINFEGDREFLVI